jgi:hypothetical protein
MHVEIGTEASQFPEKEFKHGIFFTLQGEFGDGNIANLLYSVLPSHAPEAA